MFFFEHRVQFYETDMMGIVHHSNYLRLYEEARVAWAYNRKMIDYQKPESAAYFAVLATEVKHIMPAKFGDVLMDFVAHLIRQNPNTYTSRDNLNVLALGFRIKVGFR